jgi:hypothetical protein
MHAMHAARVLPWSEGTWTNAPISTSVNEGGLQVEAAQGSDAWRHTAYQFVRESEHALLVPFSPGDAMEVDFHLDYTQQFDQAGLFIKRSRDTWVKAAVEYADGGPKLGAVVTHGVSDWSVANVPEWAGTKVTMRVSWFDDAVIVRARSAGEPFRLVRLLPFPREGKVWAGPFCCAPSRAGLRIRFSEWRIGVADQEIH